MLKYSCDSTIGTAISTFFSPLMGAQHLQIGLERRFRRLEQFRRRARSASAPHGGRAPRRSRRAPTSKHLQVVTAVAGIVEAAVAIDVDQRGAFLLRREIVVPVGRMHCVEQAEMRRDRLGEFARRAGGQHDAAAGLALFAQPLDQRRAVGQTPRDRCRRARRSPASGAPGPTSAITAPGTDRAGSCAAAGTGLPTKGRSQSACRRDRQRAGLRCFATARPYSVLAASSHAMGVLLRHIAGNGLGIVKAGRFGRPPAAAFKSQP